MSEENVELLKRANALYLDGELETMIERYLDPEIEWETRWPGLEHVFHGRDGVRDWAARVMEPMQIDMELLRAEALDDETVLAEYRARGKGRGSGIEVEMPIFDLLSFRNGLIYRRRTFRSHDEALEAAGLSE